MQEQVPDSAGSYVSVPVGITAVQWDGTEDHARILCDWADSVRGRGSAVYLPAGEPVELYGQTLEHPARIAIGTLEGTMKLEPGAWLIRGTEGEFYPCKDSVFRRKYRAAGTNPFPPRSAENPEPVTGWTLRRASADSFEEQWVLELSTGEHFSINKRTPGDLFHG